MKKNLLSLIMLCALVCFNMSVVFAQCEGTNGGVPEGPANSVYTLGVSAPSDIAATSIPGEADTGTTDYTFVVTTPSGTAIDCATGDVLTDAETGDSTTGSFIFALSDDGSFDFDAATASPVICTDAEGFPLGAYTFTGFGYNQAELDAVCSFISGAPTDLLANLLGLDVATVEAIQEAMATDCTLAVLLDLLTSLAPLPQSVDDLLVTLEGLPLDLLGLNLCFGVSEAPYTVEVVAAPECEAIAGMVQAEATVCQDGVLPAPTFSEDNNGDGVTFASAFVFTLGAPNYEILGVVNPGTDINMFGLPEGTYVMHAFTFDVADIDAINGALGTPGVTGLDVAALIEDGTICADLELPGFELAVVYDGPANDFCDGAIALDVTDGAFNGPLNNICATASTEVVDTTATACFFDEAVTNTVWYSFVGDGGTHYIYTSANCGDINLAEEGTYITEGDTQMSIFSGACDALTFVGCNEDDVENGSAAGDYFSGLTVETEADVVYYVMIDGYAGAQGEFCINVEQVGAAPCTDIPANDDCAAAATLMVEDGAVNGPFTNVCATGADGDVPACFGDATPDGGNVYDNSVWFTFEGTGDNITLTTSVDCEGITAPLIESDTQLAVFEGGCDGAEIACNDDIDLEGGNYLSSVTFATTAGMMYTVVVDGYFYNTTEAGDEGEFCINVAAEAVTPDCLADFGMVTPPANTAICLGSVSEPVMLADNNTDGFATLFAVTEGADLTIVGLDFDGVFDSNLYPNTETFYTLHAVSLDSTQIELALEAINIGTTTGGDVAGLIEAGVICAALDVAGVQFTVLPADSPDCTTLDPLAVGDANVDVNVEGNTYTVSFEVSGGSGDYSVGGEGLAGNVFTSAAIACGTPYSFVVSDNGTGESATVEGAAPCDAGDPCDENPIVITTDIDCDSATGEFTVSVSVSGGTPDPDTGYAIGGTIFNTNTATEGNPFTIGPLTDGTSYQVIITDLAACESNFQSDPVACTKCPDIELGEMPAGPVIACAGTPAIAVVSSFTLPADSAAINYALHTSPTDVPGDILAESTEGSFSFEDAAGAEYNTEYYISAIAGADNDGDGLIDDLGDECTVVLAGTPVVFLAPVSITLANTDCDGTSAQATLAFVVSGGYPAYDASATYSISGASTSDEVAAGEQFIVGPLDDGTPWAVTATDNFCGTAASENGTIDCEKTPVEWLSFTGEVKSNGNLLKWATASETESHYFAVESSRNGVDFEQIETLDAAGYSIVTNTYEFLDKYALSGTTYYRITQYDFNGDFTRTDVLSLTRGETPFGIGSVQPVPAVSHVSVIASFAGNTKADIAIYTIDGKLVNTTQVDVTEGANNIELEVTNYASGIYFITITDGQQVATDKFIKQ